MTAHFLRLSTVEKGQDIRPKTEVIKRKVYGPLTKDIRSALVKGPEILKYTVFELKFVDLGKYTVFEMKMYDV